MELPNKHLHVIDLAKRDFHSNLFHLIKKCVNVSFPENNIKSFSVVAFVVIKKKKINILYLVIRKTFRRFSEHFPSVFWSFLWACFWRLNISSHFHALTSFGVQSDVYDFNQQRSHNSFMRRVDIACSSLLDFCLLPLQWIEKGCVHLCNHRIAVCINFVFGIITGKGLEITHPGLNLTLAENRGV